MRTRDNRIGIVALTWLRVALGIQAAGLVWPAVAAAAEAAGAPVPKAVKPNDPNEAAATQWTLSTDDTCLKISVSGNKVYIVTLKNPAQDWNWTPVASEVPLPVKTANWAYRGATVERSKGTTVTLRFASTTPRLELASVWRVRPGVGPVEHQIAVVNKTAGDIVFKGDDVEAANLNLVADKPVQSFPSDDAIFGPGESRHLPFRIIKVGSTHGIYLAYDYGYGQYQATRDAANPLRLNCRFWIGSHDDDAGGRYQAMKKTMPRVPTTITAGETYHLPGMMIQTYQGDEEDAANHFRRWFWTYEITPSLRNNPKEPPIEICNPPGPDGQPDFLVNQAKTTDFAGWGVGCLKTDAWHWGTGHAKSDELAAALHAKGVKLSLYFNGNVPEKVLLDEAAKSHFDYYRSDDNGRGPAFNMRDYHSVEDFKRKLDKLAKLGVGWENCCNGGNLRSLDICRRMTFMTHSDGSGLESFFRHVYDWSYMVPPIQIKSDYWVCLRESEEGEVTVAWLRGHLLGAILTGPPASASFLRSIEQIKRVFSLYNSRQRAILRGADVYRRILPDGKGWFGLQYHNTFINKGSVLLWQKDKGPASNVVKLRGLDGNKSYHVEFEDAKDQSGTKTGAQLMDEGVTVTMGPNASEILWINCQDLPVTPRAKSR